MITKPCSKCKVTKPLSGFSKSARGKYGKHSVCNDCRRRTPEEARRQYLKTYPKTKVLRAERRLNDPKIAEVGYFKKVLYRYKVSEAEYLMVLERQNHKCAICLSPENRRDGKSVRFCVDHCHTTKTFRGLLCHRCNRAIGLLNDNEEILMQAATYLAISRMRPGCVGD